MTAAEGAAQWQAWSARRPEFRGVHLDSAAAGRSSLAVLEAVSGHALLEAQTGAYVAQAAVEPVLAACRADLARMFGLPADSVVFVESATTALNAMLSAWPIREGDSVAVTPAEWGPNRKAFRRHGLTVVELAVDPEGALDIEALERMLAQSPPAAIALTQVGSHRGLVQPVGAAAALCRAAGVPLWVDVAQAIGHVDTAVDADVLYGTSRKWLAGPRGVGVLAIAQRWWSALRLDPLMPLGDLPVVRALESHEAHVAGRLGLRAAVAEHLSDGPARVWARLSEIGRLTRATLTGLSGWEVVPAGDQSGAISALRPLDGQDVVAVRARLLAEARILTTAALPERAPGDMSGPLLRVSPQVDCTVEELVALRSALAAM